MVLVLTQRPSADTCRASLQLVSVAVESVHGEDDFCVAWQQQKIEGNISETGLTLIGKGKQIFQFSAVFVGGCYII